MKQQLIIALCAILSLNLNAQNYEDYNWQHVPIGGGGYITGMQIHPNNAEVRYYRTDIGGAYKWDAPSQSLKQLVYSTNDDHYSVAGIALNPNDESQVFLAMSRKCNPANAAIYKSYNYGEDFEVVNGLPFYFAANGGRDCGNSSDKDRQGTPLAINPLNTAELYIGTREKGLYVMNLTNNTVQQVGANVLVQNSDRSSIRSVVFHPTQKNKVFIGYANYGVFIGNTQNGAYWNLDYNDIYPDLKEVSDISISKNGDYMLAACKKMGIWKCNDPAGQTATWQQVKPNNNNGEGYLTVACSPHNNNTAITVVADWAQISNFEYTTNAGGVWNDRNGSAAPNIYDYKTDGHGSHVSQIRFDPNNDKGLYYSSWFSTYHTPDWTVNNINWSNEKSKGHEEVVVTDITTFPINSANNFLQIHSGDHTGFIYDDISDANFPNDMLKDRVNNNDTDRMIKGATSDFCESNPAHIVCNFIEKWDNSPGLNDNTGSIVTSNNGGESFNRLSSYNESLGRSLVAMSSTTPSNIVLANRSGVQYIKSNMPNFLDAAGTNNVNNLATCNNTGNFNCLAASNLNSSKINTSVFSVVRALVADKVLGCVFYFYDMTNGSFHTSTNGGENWCVVNNTDLPSFGTDRWKHKTRLTAIPGKAKHLWINFNNDLFRSTNGGQNWSRISTVDKTVSLAVGKAAPGASYPTLYLFGSIVGETGNFFYRSSDEGNTWTRINSNEENELWGSAKIIEADRNVYGRVYAGVSGQGLVYGDIAAPIIDDCDNANLIINPSFENDFTNWQTRTGNGATANFQAENGGTDGSKQAKITVINIGGNYWDIQIKKQSLFFEEGVEYSLSYDIKANKSALFSYGSNRKAGGTIMSGTGTANTQWQAVEKTFIANTADEAIFLLNFGHQANTIFYVDNIQVKKVCEDLPQEPMCNHPNLLSNASFENDLTDWETRNANGSNVNFNTINNADIDGSKVAQIEVNTIGNNYWDIQLKRPNLNFENGVDYVLSFAIKANQNNLQFSYGSNQAAGNVSIFNGTGLAATQWQTVSKTFTANSANVAYLVLNFGYQMGTFYVDKVQLKKVCTDQAVPTPTPNNCNLIVTNINDSGPNSLKEVINCAADGATITIHNSLSDYNIFIQNNPILINKNLTIVSDESMPTFLNATNVQRVFEVEAGSTLNLRHVNLVGGQANTGNVINNEGKVIMQHAEVFNCIINPFPENPRLGGNGDYSLLPDVLIHK